MQQHDHEAIYRHVIDAISRADGLQGMDGFRRTSFPDLRGSVETALPASGDHVVGRVTWYGTQHGFIRTMTEILREIRVHARRVSNLDFEKAMKSVQMPIWRICDKYYNLPANQ
jgi:predicted ester cyclase